MYKTYQNIKHEIVFRMQMVEKNRTYNLLPSQMPVIIQMVHKINLAPLFSANNKPQNTQPEIELKCALRLMLNNVRM